MGAVLFVAMLAALGAAAYAWIFFKRYSLEHTEHQRVLALFSRYVPSPVVEELLARKDPRLFEAREYYATILSVRIRNFALFAEKLSPEETLQYLNEFYTIVGQAVQRHRGMIESLRGDTVTAVFGVLVEEQFQEERALRAALDILRLMRAMESRWTAQGRKALEVGMGVNSGKIIAGDTGFQQRREFSIVGNPAHVAARLEAASEELRATIVASAATYDAVRELFNAVPASSIPLRGLRALQDAYIVRGLSKRGSDDDGLTMPAQASFSRTVVHPSEPLDARPYEPDEYVAPEPEAPARIEERRPAAVTESRGFSRLDDHAPALPEKPPLLGTYEDDAGPPFQLPP